MSVNVRISWNESAFRDVLQESTVPQAVWRAAGKVRDRAKMNITKDGRVDTGAMRASIVGRRMSRGSGVWYLVGSNLDYAMYQHEGTQGPIVPRRAKVLRFTPSGGGVAIFRPSVRGVTASKFLTRALETLTVGDFAP